MSTVENTDSRRDKGSPYWLVICLPLAYALGIHLGQIAAIASPWPENMGALIAGAPLNWRIPGRMGMVLVLALMVIRLSRQPMYRTPSRFLSTLGETLRRMNGRHYSAAVGVGLFVLPLIFMAGMHGFTILLVYGLSVVAGALLVNFGLAGRAILGAAWLVIGFVNADALGSSWRVVQRDCRPGVHILLKTGEAYPCTSVQLLTLYSGLLIHNDGNAMFVRASQLEMQSLEDAAGRRAAAAFE